MYHKSYATNLILQGPISLIAQVKTGTSVLKSESPRWHAAISLKLDQMFTDSTPPPWVRDHEWGRRQAIKL